MNEENIKLSVHELTDSLITEIQQRRHELLTAIDTLESMKDKPLADKGVNIYHACRACGKVWPCDKTDEPGHSERYILKSADGRRQHIQWETGKVLLPRVRNREIVERYRKKLDELSRGLSKAAGTLGVTTNKVKFLEEISHLMYKGE